MKDKTSLVILFGGESSEHEVSCVSAASLLEHVDKEKYHIVRYENILLHNLFPLLYSSTKPFISLSH